jgi:hypothetical protein
MIVVQVSTAQGLGRCAGSGARRNARGSAGNSNSITASPKEGCQLCDYARLNSTFKDWTHWSASESRASSEEGRYGPLVRPDSAQLMASDLEKVTLLERG